MKVKNIVWKEKTGQYESGKKALIGKVKVGEYYWNGIDRDESIRYLVECTLPGIIKTKRGFPTEAEAKAEVERLVKVWFEHVTE